MLHVRRAWCCPYCACLCTKAVYKPAHSSTCRAKQQTNVERSNSDKLRIAIYIIYTETQKHRDHFECRSSATQLNRGQLPAWLSNFCDVTAHSTARLSKHKSSDETLRFYGKNAKFQGVVCAGWAMLGIFCSATKQK
eukprot:994140-Pelagomonas_calceolata.AAC.1